MSRGFRERASTYLPTLALLREEPLAVLRAVLHPRLAELEVPEEATGPGVVQLLVRGLVGQTVARERGGRLLGGHGELGPERGVLLHGEPHDRLAILEGQR